MILIGIGSILLGLLVGFILRNRLSKNSLESAENLSARIIDEAKKEAETIKKEAILQAKENLLKVKTEFEKDTRDRKLDLDNLEKKIRSKEENIDKRIDQLAQKEADGEVREKSLITGRRPSAKNTNSSTGCWRSSSQKLEQIAGIPRRRRRTILIQSMEAERSGKWLP